MPDTQTAPDKKTKPGILKYLDNTFSDDGLKTDVKITLTNETLVKVIATAVAATVLSTLSYFMIRNMFKPRTTHFIPPTL